MPQLTPSTPPPTEELIKARILTHEQRPYSRLLKRCNSLTSPDLVVSGDSAQRLREEIDLDFKFFESVITRIQLLKDTNRREVERYEKEKGDICECPPSCIPPRGGTLTPQQ